MTTLATERAPAKINLCLFVGPTRIDGRHELVTLFDSVDLCDELEVVAATADEVVCDGVEGPNLVTAAVSSLRAAGWDGPPISVRIDKRIPIAAGMGGGSADAAALLRIAPRLAPIAGEEIARIAAGLGADVPAQLSPGPCIGTGAGETLEPVKDVPPYAVLVLPQPIALSTADVYRAADRMGGRRSAADLAGLRSELAAQLPVSLPGHLVVNDLEPAALSLAPQIAEALAGARGAGADHALVCGSGPTVTGVYLGTDGAARAAAARDRVRGAFAGAVVARPVRSPASLRGGVGESTANE
jgi:4-diphosphocytidyl-2-C-methyl-D-erythritol kinase